jgi:hypothetical protein
MGTLGDCNEDSEERYETYDPEGWRGNLQCDTCKTTFGSTKSSDCMLEKSVIAVLINELSYPEVKYLQDANIITEHDLMYYTQCDDMARQVFIKLYKYKCRKLDEANHTHLMYTSIKKSFEEHDFDKCPEIMCRGEWYPKEKIEWLIRMLS